MRELIETIRCANLLPILLIKGKKDAHLGASLKIFPIVRGQRRDRMNKTCGSMVDTDGFEYTAVSFQAFAKWKCKERTDTDQVK